MESTTVDDVKSWARVQSDVFGIGFGRLENITIGPRNSALSKERKVLQGLVTETRLFCFAASGLKSLLLGLLTPLTSYSLTRRSIDVVGDQEHLRALLPCRTQNARPRAVCGLDLLRGEWQRKATQ